MPPKLLYDIDSLNLEKISVGMDEVRKVNQQRFEMEQLSGILYFNPEEKVVVGVRELGEDEFWVRGHVPGRPLYPGVLMCECAAQLCSFYYGKVAGADRFLGFGGLEDVKFRGQVVPGDRLIVIALNTEMRSRRAKFATQGLVNGNIVFEGTIIGMPM